MLVSTPKQTGKNENDTLNSKSELKQSTEDMDMGFDDFGKIANMRKFKKKTKNKNTRKHKQHKTNKHGYLHCPTIDMDEVKPSKKTNKNIKRNQENLDWELSDDENENGSEKHEITTQNSKTKKKAKMSDDMIDFDSSEDNNEKSENMENNDKLMDDGSNQNITKNIEKPQLIATEIKPQNMNGKSIKQNNINTVESLPKQLKNKESLPFIDDENAETETDDAELPISCKLI